MAGNLQAVMKTRIMARYSKKAQEKVEKVMQEKKKNTKKR